MPTTINIGLAAVTGLAFSPLDFNLWHPTTTRGAADEPGHGVNTAFDNSRTPATAPSTGMLAPGPSQGGVTTKSDVREAAGDTSFYFGLDKLRSRQRRR